MGPDVERHTSPPAEVAARILIVDDEPPVLQAVRGVIEQMGHQAREANDGAQAIAALESEVFDLVVTDLRMPNQDGFAVVRRARELPAHTPAVVLTASASIADCVEAMQAGAFNFLVKPLNRDELRKVVSSALSAARLQAISAEESPPGAGQPQAALIGESPLLRHCLDIVDNVAPTDATVLLLGESGTGKEVVARLIHDFSSRAAGPFVAVDCAALPEALAESELFGQARGGSSAGQPGSFAPLGGGILLFNMLLGEVAFGGLGTGLVGLLMAAVVAVFLGGLMIGRTPEYLGKSMGAAEVRWAILYALVLPAVVLTLAALAVSTEAGRSALGGNPGMRRFT